MKICNRMRASAFAVAFASLAWSSAYARHGEAPYSFVHAATMPKQSAPRVELNPVNQAALLKQDSDAFARAASDGAVPNKKLRVGVTQSVDISPASAGSTQQLADGSSLWQVTLHAANATDLRFGFDAFNLPQGATLHIVNTADHDYQGPFTNANARGDGHMWTVPTGGDTLTLEVHVPAGQTLANDAFRISSVAAGYRNATGHGGPVLFGAGQSGTCNVDVVCPLGDDYRDDIRAVAKYYFEEPDGTYLCTGTLLNNTAADDSPIFLSANHCISTEESAESMSLIWNYQSPTCGQHGGGSTSDTQEDGAVLLAHRTDVDFSLVKLNSTPPAEYNVYYAGWDATGDVPQGSIGIHHPSGWVKAITQTDHELTTMNSCIGSGGSQTHWRTGSPYSQGTTEGGSSGSAIVDPAGDPNGHEKLVIGTLSGGSAACSGSVPNSGYDCYGKLSVAFDGDDAGSRLKDVLDPSGSGVTTLEGKNPEGGAGGGDPAIAVDPTSIEGSVDAGASTTADLAISNTGGGDLTWSITEAEQDSQAHFPSHYGPLRHATPIGDPNAVPQKLAPHVNNGTAQLPHPAGAAVAPAFGIDQSAAALASFDAADPSVLTDIPTSGDVSVKWGGAFLNGDTSTEYLLGDDGFSSIDTATGELTGISADAGGGDVWGMTVDPTDQTLYWVGPTSAPVLSTIDATTGATTAIGEISGLDGDTINAVAINAAGLLYGIDSSTDSLVAIDKTTGAAEVIGSIGFDTNFVASMAFDPVSGVLYLAGPDAGAGNNMYTVDVATGMATLIAPLDTQITAMALTGGGGGPPPAGCTSPVDVPWLSVDPTSGTTTGGSSSTATVTMDATGLTAGDYSADLCVASNDATNALLTVPVALTVTEGGGGGGCDSEDTIFCDGFDGDGGTVPPGDQPVQDPSFEATEGDGGANPSWDSVDGNPGANGGTVFYSTDLGQARTGDFGAWFGGWASGDAEVQYFSQSVTMPATGPAFLNYWRFVSAPPDAAGTMTVSVDDVVLQTVDLSTTAADSDFTSQSVDVAAYADGAAHVIKFNYDYPGGAADGNIFIDDVTVDATEGSASAPPHPARPHNPNARKTRR